MKKLFEIMKNRWEKQKVKFSIKNEKPIWEMRVRTADCAICKKHLEEKKINDGFKKWAILSEITNVNGNAPEICPDCIKEFNIPSKPPRRKQCKMCGIVQREKIYGIGFPGWISSHEPQVKEMIRGYCPNCYLKIIEKMPQFIHSTWTDITFASNSLLTSTKMTQLDANFDALAAGDSGHPEIETDALKNKNVTYAKLNTDIWSNVEPGSLISMDLSANVVSRYTTSPSYQVFWQITTYNIGNKLYWGVRFKAQGTYTAYIGLRLLVGGSWIQLTSTSEVNETIAQGIYDISSSTGQKTIQLGIKTSSGGSAAYIRAWSAALIGVEHESLASG